jgi:hypothetical protein
VILFSLVTNHIGEKLPRNTKAALGWVNQSIQIRLLLSGFDFLEGNDGYAELAVFSLKTVWGTETF